YAVAVNLVVVVDFLRRTVARHDIRAGILQPERQLHGLPRPRIHRRIVDRLRPLERVVVQPPQGLRDVRVVADWTAGVVEPYAIFRHRPDRVDLERVVVDPFADGVPEPARFAEFPVHFDTAVGRFRKRPSVGPDDPPPVVVLVEDGNLVLVLKNLDPEIVMIVAWESQGLAAHSRVVRLRGRNGVGALETFMRAVQLEAMRRIRELVFGSAVVWLELHARRLVDQLPLSFDEAPRPGKAAAGRRPLVFLGDARADRNGVRPGLLRSVLRKG